MRTLPQRLAGAAILTASPIAGWLFAEHGDPNGALMRWTLGLLIGEFR